MAALSDEVSPLDAWDLAAGLVLPESARLLDLGCGTGRSRPQFERQFPGVRWRGVDVPDSQEVRTRPSDASDIDTFDGVHLPYAAGSFDLVYANQVFEHVRHPDELMREVRRVLADGGRLVGEVSYLEPYHSRSIFNFTPYGCLRVLKEAGFEQVHLWPSRDVLTLTARAMTGPLRHRLDPLLRLQALYGLIEVAGRVSRVGMKQRALVKLLFSGSITFSAVARSGDTAADPG